MKNQLEKFSYSSSGTAFIEFILALTMLISGYFLTVVDAENWMILYFFKILGFIVSSFGVVKIFTIQHDCGHKSFTGKKTIDDLIGRLCSFFTLIPYSAWKLEHGAHHSSFCSIEKRTLGDVYVMSIDEFKKSTKIKQFLYRLFRSKFFVLGVAPLAFLLIRCRFAIKGNNKQKSSARWTNIFLGTLYFVFIQYEILSIFNLLFIWHIAGTIAMILFYNEHQYEQSEWRKEIDWSYDKACTNASSVIDFPIFISWATGNIGYHHIHHINPRIPSYNIRQAYMETINTIPHHVIKPKNLLFPIGFLLWSSTQNKFVKSL